MQYPYWTWKNCISVEDCDLILESCKKLETIKGSIGPDKQSSKSRNSNVAWVHDLGMKQLLHSIGTSINISAFGFDLYTDPAINEVQFTEYASLEKQKYDYHLDSIFYEGKNSFSDRKLSLVVQLSDPDEYEGGDLVFNFSSDEHIAYQAKEKGTVIGFPSWILHKITPVTKGTRHSLVTWLNGPTWK